MRMCNSEHQSILYQWPPPGPSPPLPEMTHAAARRPLAFHEPHAGSHSSGSGPITPMLPAVHLRQTPSRQWLLG